MSVRPRAVRGASPTRRCALLVAAAVLCLLAAVLVPAGALAATCPRTSVADLEDEVMCPVCKTPLGLAQEAPQADRERAFILERVERCESKPEIKLALAAEFGDEVLAEPQGEGFDLAVYLVPAIALAAALGACVVAVLRWRRNRPAFAAGLPVPSGDDERAGADREPGTGADRRERHSDSEAQRRLDRDLERYDH